MAHIRVLLRAVYNHIKDIYYPPVTEKGQYPSHKECG